MILRYSRITEYFVSVSTCSPRLSSNWRQFLFNYRLAFSFFFILVLPLYLSSFCVLSIPKWFSTCLFPFYPTYECVSFEMYTLHPFPPPSSFRHSFSISHISSLLRFIFPLLLVSVRFFYIYIYVSGYRGANRISVWQTRLIFSKGRIFAKNRQNAVAIVELDCSSKMHFFFMEYVIN